MQLKLHRKAEVEIREAATWYDAQSAGLGHRFVRAVAAAFELPEREPNQFAALETTRDFSTFRRVLIDGFHIW